jgi:hypothetical protein
MLSCIVIAKRTCVVELGEPWTNVIVERSMTSLKFYHDFSCDVEHFSYAFGPCWEPVIAQCNLSKYSTLLNLYYRNLFKNITVVEIIIITKSFTTIILLFM